MESVNENNNDNNNNAAFEAHYQRVLSVGEECISPEELRNLLEKKPKINFYDGFEPSGRLSAKARTPSLTSLSW